MRILIVDDHEVVRAGVKRILEKELGQIVFGEARTGSEALGLVNEHAWDVVILDLTLGDRGGLDVLREVKEARPGLPVLILTAHAEEQYARRAFKGGAAGYITKGSPGEELAKAVHKVIRGRRYVSPALAEALVVEIEKGTDRPPHESLSAREFEVMRLIASGKTVGEIADILSLSVTTISTYRARVLQKMAMRTNAELTHYAIKIKLVD